MSSDLLWWVPVQTTTSPKLSCSSLCVTKSLYEDSLQNSVLQLTEIKIYSFYCKTQKRLKEMCVVKNSNKNRHRDHTKQDFLQRQLHIDQSLRPRGRMPWIILRLWEFLCIRDPGRRGKKNHCSYSTSCTFLLPVLPYLYEKNRRLWAV